MRHIFGSMVLATGLLACQGQGGSSTHPEFVKQMTALCGETLIGSVVSDDPQDADWRGEVLTVGPLKCTQNQMIAPLAVGDDTSRVWTITQVGDYLTLSHAHTLEDGTPDPVTGYGGKTTGPGSATRQNFPADQHSKDVFMANGLDVSVTNVWTLEVKAGELFAYELNREGRHFRAEFPLK